MSIWYTVESKIIVWDKKKQIFSKFIIFLSQLLIQFHGRYFCVCRKKMFPLAKQTTKLILFFRAFLKCKQSLSKPICSQSHFVNLSTFCLFFNPFNTSGHCFFWLNNELQWTVQTDDMTDFCESGTNSLLMEKFTTHYHFIYLNFIFD